MKILITGSGGMLGSAMIPVLRAQGHEVYPTDKNPEKGIEYLDVREYDQILKWAEKIKPDFIFHLAAETDLEICENDPYYAYQTNTIGTQNVVYVCKRLKIKMVYICTAGVFDGKKEGFYTEFDEALPLSVYGKSKLEGEKIVREMLDEYFVCRPGWMIGGGKKDKKFVGHIVKQLKSGTKIIYAVDDKFGTPTYTKDFCNNLAQLIKTEYYGVYHIVCHSSASRYDVAQEIVRITNNGDVVVQKVHSDYFANKYPVSRPLSEMLNNFMLELRGMNLMRNWREALKEYLEENFPEIIRKPSDKKAEADKPKHKKVIIIGAGLAGLSCAYKLLQHGAEVILLEKGSEVGGLCRTIKYKDFLFDFSAHRFVAKDKELIGEMNLLMAGNWQKCSKRSRILMWDKWLNYPFELANLMLYMPKMLALRALFDYIFVTIKEKYRPSKIVSFKDWFVASFGYNLYKTNCEPYATKHWRVSPAEISSEWSAARSPASFNLKTIIKDLLTKKRASRIDNDNPYPDADSFYYPKTGGIGAIANRLAEEVRNMGGKINTDAEITKVHVDKNQASVEFSRHGAKETANADLVVSTISLDSITKVLYPTVPEEIKNHLSKLKYLNTIFLNVIINKPKISDDSWLYFPQPREEIVFCRGVEFKNWGKEMAPADKTSLCLDISCTENEAIWRENNEQELITEARKGLLRSGIIANPEEMEEGFVIKMPYTYPIYDLSYMDNLKPAINYLENNGRLKLLGRIGKFGYSNMDDVIRDGFKLAKEIIDNNQCHPIKLIHREANT